VGRRRPTLRTVRGRGAAGDDAGRAVTGGPAGLARPGRPRLLVKIDGQPAAQADVAAALLGGGCESTSQGLRHRGGNHEGFEQREKGQDA